MLQKNVGSIDRILRIVVGAAMILAFFMVEGKYSWLYLLGIIPLVTGLMSSCPLYSILGISTCKKEQ